MVKLVRSGADVNKINDCRSTALSIIAMQNDVKGLCFMLISGAKVNLGRTPFNRYSIGKKITHLLISA